MNKKLLIIPVLFIALSVFGAGCDNEGEGINNSYYKAPASTSNLSPTPTPTPANPASIDNKYSPPAKEEVKLFDEIAEKKLAIIETSKGMIKFKFYPKDAPFTAANFIKLAKANFYNGLIFHRVEPGFVIQGGDPMGSGMGGPGYNIKAEFNSRKHITGTVAMARARNPDSAGSQFYITLAPQPFLDGQYTVFGQVIEGMDVVYKINVGDKMLKVYIED